MSPFEKRNTRPAPPPMPKRGEAQPQEYAVSPEPEMAHEMAETPAAERAEHSAVVVTPEAVCYRLPDETCGNCQYMTQDSHCEVLDMAVEAGAGCNAFSMRGGEAPNEAPVPEAA